MSQPEYPRVYLYRRIVQAKLFIDDHFAEKIDLDNIADEAYFSKFHFIRLFKSIYGQTPHQYLITVRIRKSKDLLDEGVSVSETCYRVGFESLSSFSGLFKKTTGSSPSAYRAKRKQMQEQTKQVPLQFIPGCFAEKKGFRELRNFEETNN